MAKRVISARALRYLFAKGVLRGRGSGKNREVTYDRKKAAALKSGGSGYKGKERIRNAQGRTIGRQAAGTSTFRRKVGTGRRKDAGNNLNSNANAFPRTVIGGSKAARLRSGGAGGRKLHPSAQAYLSMSPQARAAKRAQGVAEGRNMVFDRAAKTLRGSPPTRENLSYRLQVLQGASTRGLTAGEQHTRRQDIGVLSGALKRGMTERTALPGAIQHQGTRVNRVGHGRARGAASLEKGVRYGSATIARNAGGYGVRGAYNKDAVRDAKRDGGQWKDGMWTFSDLKKARAYSARWYGTNRKPKR